MTSPLWIGYVLRHTVGPSSDTPRLETPMTEERKFAILFAATILSARKLAELEDPDKPTPKKVGAVETAILKSLAERPRLHHLSGPALLYAPGLPLRKLAATVGVERKIFAH